MDGWTLSMAPRSLRNEARSRRLRDRALARPPRGASPTCKWTPGNQRRIWISTASSPLSPPPPRARVGGAASAAVDDSLSSYAAPALSATRTVARSTRARAFSRAACSAGRQRGARAQISSVVAHVTRGDREAPECARPNLSR